MRTIATNNLNDIYAKDGNLFLAEGKDAIGNVCLNAIRTATGELPFDTDKGIPYLDLLFSQVANLDLFRFHILKTLQNIDGVDDVEELKLQTENDTLNYSANIKTLEGGVVING